MSITLLHETILPASKPVIAEVKEESSQKFYYLNGLFIEGETRNHNGRIYPRDEIERAVRSVNEKIASHGPIAGELDHPPGIQINADRVAVAITSMKMDGNNGYGSMRVVPAGLGLVVEGMIKAGINLGVSSRGTGRVDSNGRVAEFDIITVDVVINPSAPNAYPQATLAEAIQGHRLGNELSGIAQYLHDTPKAQKMIVEDFRRIIAEIKNIRG